MAAEQNANGGESPSELEDRVAQLEKSCRECQLPSHEERLATLENIDHKATFTDLQKRLVTLEAAKHCKVPDCTGGMLSSTDFGNLVVHRDHPEYKGQKFEDFLGFFRKRNWGKVEGKIIIDPFDELNLTPFSYDLSIGARVVSIRESERIEYRLPYELEPRETVIVLTHEFIALPPDYAATVWPRFGMVHEGLFQSMVKIDPTWYGHLGVALCNLSPRTYKLKEDEAFGTLILYGLSSRTKMDLITSRDPLGLRTVDVDIKTVTRKAELAENLNKDFKGVAWLEADKLHVRGLKQADYVRLLDLDSSQAWKDAVREAKKRWLDKMKGPTTGRETYRVAGLGMTDLAGITRAPKGVPLAAETLGKAAITMADLKEAAIHEGKPFDLICALQETIKQEMQEEMARSIDSAVASTVFPNVLVLVLRLIGTLSLVVALVAFIMQRFVGLDARMMETNTVGVMALSFAVLLMLGVFWFKPVRSIILRKEITYRKGPLRQPAKPDKEEWKRAGDDKTSATEPR